MKCQIKDCDREANSLVNGVMATCMAHAAQLQRQDEEGFATIVEPLLPDHEVFLELEIPLP